MVSTADAERGMTDVQPKAPNSKSEPAAELVSSMYQGLVYGALFD